MAVRADEIQEPTIVTVEAHRGRAKWLWKQSSFETYEDLSIPLSNSVKGTTDKGFFSWYVGKSKTVDAIRAEHLARVLAGSVWGWTRRRSSGTTNPSATG